MAFNPNTFGTQEQDSPVAGVFKNPTSSGGFNASTFGSQAPQTNSQARGKTPQQNPVIETFRKGGERIVEETQKIKPATDLPSFGTGVLQSLKTFGTGALETLKGAGAIVAEPFRQAFKLIPEDIKKQVGDTAEEALQNAYIALPEDSKKKVISAVQFLQENPEYAEVAQDTADLLINTLALGTGGSKQIASAATRASKTLGEGGTALRVGAETALTAEKRDFVRSLIRPEQTKAVKEAQVSRTTEKGFGIFKKSDVAPTSRELQAEKYVLEIPNVKKNNTVQQNFNAIQTANRAEAENLVKQLSENDFVYSRKELLSRLNKAKEELSRNPVITGDAEKTAEKLIAEFERRINESAAKGSNLLQVRKEFDSWVESQKGGNVFDPAKENAFSVSNRAIRQTVNDFLEEKAVNVGVKDSLKKQSSLYTAMDNLVPKAAKEADTAIGRLGQKASQILGTKNKAVQALAAVVGIGGLGAAATFAPAAAVLGLGGGLVYQGGKLVLGPNTRKVVGTVLEELLKKQAENVGGVITAGGVSYSARELDALIADLEEFVSEYSEGEEQ